MCISQITAALELFAGSMFWNTFTLLLLLAAGIYLTVKLDFLPFRHCRRILQDTLGTLFHPPAKSSGSSNSFSPFQAVTTSLAGTMGIGNIVGISTAITLGGPGAVLWMILGALFGMCTKYAEILLAVRYRRKKNGGWAGGPMYYLSEGVGSKKLGWLFALLCALCALGIGNMTQSNSIAEAVLSVFAIPKWITGNVVLLLCALAIGGGVRRIGQVTERLVPVMSLLYLAGCLWVIWQYRSVLPQTLLLIVKSALGIRPAAGGFAGILLIQSMRYGFSRGVFSNEAGLGSAPIAHGSSDCSNCVRQGFWGILEVFWDTVVGCTATALVVLTSGLWNSGLSGGVLTVAAFSQSFGSWGGVFVALSIAVFAVSSIIGWWVYGEKAIQYLSGDRKQVLSVYKVIFLSAVFWGAVAHLGAVWEISDILNGLMALPNLIALFLLAPEILQETHLYFHPQNGTGQTSQKKPRENSPSTMTFPPPPPPPLPFPALHKTQSTQQKS